MLKRTLITALALLATATGSAQAQPGPASVQADTPQVATVRQMWNVFLAGRRTEVPDLFLTPNAVIRVQGAPHVPFVGTFTNRAQHRKFFELGGAKAEKFVINKILGSGEDVISLGEFDFRVTSTGRHYKGRWALHHKVVGNKITYWEIFEDAWSVGLAFDKPRG